MATERKIPPSGLFLTEWREREASPRKTVEEVGSFVKKDKSTVSRWETGERRIFPDMQRKFAKAVDCDPEDLFRHPDDPGPEDHARAKIAAEITRARP